MVANVYPVRGERYEGRRELPVDMSFIDRRGNLVRPDKKAYYAREAAGVGEAYAFFDCDASKQELEDSISDVMDDAGVPREMRAFLRKGSSGLPRDSRLQAMVNYPADYRVMTAERKKQGWEPERKPLCKMEYSLVASFPGASNEEAALQLGDALDLIHWRFNRDSGVFRGAVVYEEGGEYGFRY